MVLIGGENSGKLLFEVRGESRGLKLDARKGDVFEGFVEKILTGDEDSIFQNRAYLDIDRALKSAGRTSGAD